MEEITKLRRLIDFGIPVVVLARECYCTPASIQNYLSGRSVPNGNKIIGIRNGLNKMVSTLEAIVKE